MGDNLWEQLLPGLLQGNAKPIALILGWTRASPNDVRKPALRDLCLGRNPTLGPTSPEDRKLQFESCPFIH